MTPFRIYRIPTPLGPFNLWPLALSISIWQLIHIDRNLAECLHRIGMEQNTMFLCNFPDFLARLNGADLVIGKHDT